ncbi:MAG TPA: CPBP family intramembrane metalloprotease [Bacteroidales bacterium]|nr:CPBP family intramembrane metalloprotease [Bacteroidales bacterium]HRZ76657.1 CPBP family intramembrane metalloprotease [Bacteroidales bacterium]
MKRFIGYFRDFHREYFSFRAYGLALLFLAALIAFNYSIELEDHVIDRHHGTALHGLLFFALHAFSWAAVFLIFQLTGRKRSVLNGKALLKLLLGFLILALDRSFYYHRELLMEISRPETYRYFAKISHNLLPALTVMLPLFLLRYLFDRGTREGLYGLRFRNIQLKAYWVMLGIMTPLVFFASLTPDFIAYYPVYKRAHGALFASALGIPELYAKVMFEVAYLMNFLFVELFFRGFLVIGMSRLLGGNAVFAMAATYCAYHFGKPMGETISSVFGGYILGVIALYSRNIYGGVFIHGGIALLMELFAMVQQPR